MRTLILVLNTNFCAFVSNISAGIDVKKTARVVRTLQVTLSGVRNLQDDGAEQHVAPLRNYHTIYVVVLQMQEKREL